MNAIDPALELDPFLGECEVYHVVLNVCDEWLIANFGGYAYYLLENSGNLLERCAVLKVLQFDYLVHPDEVLLEGAAIRNH